MAPESKTTGGAAAPAAAAAAATRTFVYEWEGQEEDENHPLEGITHLRIGPEVQQLAPRLFANHPTLQVVELHDFITIGEEAFMGCPQLQVVKVARTNLDNTTDGGTNSVGATTAADAGFAASLRYSMALLNPATNKSYHQTTTTPATTIEWALPPESGRSDGTARYSAGEAPASEYITVGPSGVRIKQYTIGAYAFYKCANLVALEIPNTTRSIYRYAFCDCPKLRTVRFAPTNSLRDIGSAALAHCDSLMEVVIPPSVRLLDSYAFDSCAKLRYVSISHKTRIGYAAFTNCPSLDLNQAMNQKHPNPNFIASMLEYRFRLGKKQQPKDLKNLVQMTVDSKRLQMSFNKRISERLPTFILFLGAYVNCALAFCFIFATVEFFAGTPNHIATSFCFVFVGYFFLREVFQAGFQKWYYLSDLWNIADLLRVALVIASGVVLLKEKGGDEISMAVRTLLLLTGGTVIINGIIYLRSTFLPFAEFVGGLIQILITLGPFLVVSTLLIFAFAFMYYASNFEVSHATTFNFDETSTSCEDENGFCTLSQSMLTSFAFFFSGPEQTSTWWLDLLFGYVVVVILLNVVIAIVSDAWSDSTKKAATLFWEYRISFLAELESLPTFMPRRRRRRKTKKVKKRQINDGKSSDKEKDDDDDDDGISAEYYNDNVRSIEERIARWAANPRRWRNSEDVSWFDLFCYQFDIQFGNRALSDSIPWNEEPYVRAKDNFDMYMVDVITLSELYQHRKITLEEREKLFRMRSFEREWYWSTKGKISKMKILWDLFLYGVVVVLGVLTLGLLWPDRFREYTFSHTVEDSSSKVNKTERGIAFIEETLGLNTMANELDDEDDDSQMMMMPRETIEGRLARLEAHVAAITTKIAAIEETTHSKLDEILAKLNNGD